MMAAKSKYLVEFDTVGSMGDTIENRLFIWADDYADALLIALEYGKKALKLEREDCPVFTITDVASIPVIWFENLD
jgi:hypothetical protein